MKSLTLKSPAKLNLYLKVTGRRPDGYHNLVTIFHRISLADTLSLSKSKKGFSLKCRMASGLGQKLSSGEDNLIAKAYRLLEKEVPGLGGVSVRLTKRIPLGAGLGGGSGNAAAFLTGMKKLYSLPISQARLMKLGARLGADVAFFVSGWKQALGEGVGDRLKPMKAGARHWFILIVSAKGLSTPKVYRNLPRKLPAVTLTKIERTVKLLTSFLEQKRYHQAGRILENDLELPAFFLRPSLKQIVTKINRRGLSAVKMTGSGPTVFAIAPDFKQASRFAKILRRDFPAQKVIVCSSY